MGTPPVDWAQGHHQLPIFPVLSLQLSVTLCTASIKHCLIHPTWISGDRQLYWLHQYCQSTDCQRDTSRWGLIHFETFETNYFYLDSLGDLTDGWSWICTVLLAVVRLPQSWSILDQHGWFSLCIPSCVKQLPLFSEDVGWNWHN